LGGTADTVVDTFVLAGGLLPPTTTKGNPLRLHESVL
jgi:hypothetical protein